MSLDIILKHARKMNDKQRATSCFVTLKQGKQSHHGFHTHSATRLTTIQASIFSWFKVSLIQPVEQPIMLPTSE
jgi:hypothetical protein